MKITADTNVLVRAVVLDDPEQTALAQSALARADRVVVTISALCEFVWVLARRYKIAAPDIARSVMSLIDSGNVVTDRRAVDSGVALLAAGGDFADGVIAFEGARLDGETFLSFDRKAVALIQAQGGSASLLG